MSGLLLGALLLGAAPPEEDPSALTWTLRVDGVERVLAGAQAVELPGGLWRCGVSFRREARGSSPATTTGTLSCRAGREAAVHTLVMCEERPVGPTDRGAGTLLLGAGEATVTLELGCHVQGAPPAPRLPLEPGTTPGAKAGLPAQRLPPRPGVYRWDLVQGGDPAPGSDAAPASAASEAQAPRAEPGGHARIGDGWSCTSEIAGVEDPSLGYAEYGALVCVQGELRATTLVPCVRIGGSDHTCQAGTLLLDGPGQGQRRFLLACEDVGNPGCF